MFNEKEIGAFLLFIWQKDDFESNVIEELDSTFLVNYNDVSQRVIAACSDILINLEYVENDRIELQAYLYEVGKRYFGTKKEELLFWFKCLYTIFFQDVVGPRIGEFVYIFGVDNFLDKLEKRLNNPFELRR